MKKFFQLLSVLLLSISVLANDYAAAKAQGIKFSADRKTLLSCPKNVTKVVIPYGVTTIGYRAFFFCRQLTNVTIPNSVTSIKPGAFDGCRELTNVTIPDSVTSIGDRAFSGCVTLTNITIPDSINAIGKLAFSKNVFCKTKIKNITIPSSTTNISEGAFAWAVDSVTLADGNPAYKVTEDGALIDIRNNTLLYLPPSVRGTYTVPDGIKRIGEYAFAECSKLTNIILSENVAEIGKYAFSGCKLKSITIPAGVTAVNEGAFAYGVESVTLADSNSIYKVTEDGALIDTKNNTLLYFPPSFQGTYTVPDGIKRICKNAFAECSKLTNIILSSSVSHIEESAFSSCRQLTNFVIPNGVTKIRRRTFSNCTNLNSVIFHDNISTIEYGAFYNCKELKSVTLSKKTKTSPSAFPYRCKIIRKK